MQTISPYYEQAQSRVIAFDLSTFSKLSLTGKDRAAFLQNFTTNDVIKPGVGSGCETFLTTAQARIVAWLRVAIRENDLYLTMEPGLIPKVIDHLVKYIIGEDVQFEDRTEKDFFWLVTGRKLFNKIPEVSEWMPWQNRSIEWGGVNVSMQRCDFLGLPGVFVWGASEHAAKAMTKMNELNIPLLASNDPLWKVLRVEAGTPAYGIDIDETMLPQEANRTEQAISFNKGCYIGQETVARIRAYGHVNRQLRRLKIDGDPETVWQGAALKINDKEVGKLMTVAWSPKGQSLLAFGLVRKEHLQAGTLLQALAIDSNTCQASVLATT
ncbi:MAG TPA: glycine cleavage T C-terminal barrel domain-containing protein [Gemmatales bacterium]|nr:glycine cleavage T C-terminal barrel domain-containing protein [Gemmatales bacterium]